jgi:hypothetical protein
MLYWKLCEIEKNISGRRTKIQKTGFCYSISLDGLSGEEDGRGR